MLGLHFLGPVQEAQLVGWFLPWLYLALAGFTLWLWQLVQTRTGEVPQKITTILIGVCSSSRFCSPQYFKEDSDTLAPTPGSPGAYPR